MTEADIIKIGCVVVCAIGLAVITQIYKPQIIEKTCDIINNNITTSTVDVKYEQIEYFYNYVTLGTIATLAGIAISCIVAFASHVDPMSMTIGIADPSLIYVSQKLELIAELNAVENLNVVTNYFSNNPESIIRMNNLEMILILKSYASQIPIPLMFENLLNNISSITNTKQLLNALEALGNYSILNFHYSMVLKDAEIGFDFMSAHNAIELRDFTNLYLYSLLDASYNDLVLSQYGITENLSFLESVGIDLLNKFNQDSEFTMNSLDASVGILSYFSTGLNFLDLFNLGIDIDSRNLALRYLAWADLIHQVDISHSLKNIEQIGVFNSTPIDIYNISNAFEELISTPEGKEVYKFFKNVFITSLK